MYKLHPSKVHLRFHYFKILLSYSLKRTTDVMFGGKQVLVCGYGEVSELGPSREFFHSLCNCVHMHIQRNTAT